jgi:hypothetical protein
LHFGAGDFDFDAFGPREVKRIQQFRIPMKRISLNDLVGFKELIKD